jgi:hypothetical protein
MTDQPGRRRIVMPVRWALAVLTLPFCGLWYAGCFSTPQTTEDRFEMPEWVKTEFEEKYERAKRATTEAEVRAFFQGYSATVTDGSWDDVSRLGLKRRAVRMLLVEEKKDAGEGDFVAEFYFDKSGRLVGSALHLLLH